MQNKFVSEAVLESVEKLQELASPDEAIWISGYFAGWARSRVEGPKNNPGLTAPARAIPAPNAPGNEVTVLYGTETGNAAAIAEELSGNLRDSGIRVTQSDLADFPVQELKKTRQAVFITSTHGDGDPPELAKAFFEDLDGRKAPDLKHLSFTILGLGDSSYEHFCAASRSLQQRLIDLGATMLMDTVECDVDFVEQAEKWSQSVLEHFKTTPADGVDCAGGYPGSVSSPDAMQATNTENHYSRQNPFAARVLENINLTGRGSSKRVHHIELSLEDSGLLYTPGDALGVVPVNEPALVDDLLEAVGLTGEEIQKSNSDDRSLRERLLHDYEITTVTPRFLEFWAQASEAGELQDFLPAQGRDSFSGFAGRHHVIDVMRKFPVRELTAGDLLSGLRPLQPRLYSIASCQAAVDEEVHITVSRLQYEMAGTTRNGVASGCLCDRIMADASINVFVQGNSHFRLPQAPETPVIMIGAGTGIAPYRAFMQARERQGITSGRAWLFFGERNFRTDFLYQVEWQKWLKNKVLTHIDMAFSRDQDSKIYVHHRLLERGKRLYEWLEEGATIYVCGDATQMAVDVHGALRAIIEKERNVDSEQAEQYLKDLTREKRYLKDVY